LLAAFVMRMTLGEKEMRDGSGWSPMSQNWIVWFNRIAKIKLQKLVVTYWKSW
jgi:hypothetical protein